MYSSIEPYISNGQEGKANDPLKDDTADYESNTVSTAILATVLYYFTGLWGRCSRAQTYLFILLSVEVGSKIKR